MPMFEGPYRVLEMRNNNLTIWKKGRRVTVNIDQVRVHHPRHSDANSFDSTNETIYEGKGSSNGSSRSHPGNSRPFDAVFNILNAELSSCTTSFDTSLNAGFALGENRGNLFVESYKTSPVLQVHDSAVPNSVLVRKGVQDFIQKVQDMRRMQHGSKPILWMVYEAFLRVGANIRPSPEFAERLSLPDGIPTPPAQPERIPTPPSDSESMPTPPAERERMPTPPAERERMPTPPAERPPLEMVDPSVFVNKVEVTPRIPTPPLITRCDKGTQTISPYLHVKRLDLGKRLLEQQQANKRLFTTIKQEPLGNPVPKNIVLLVSSNHPLMKLGNNGFIIQPTNVNKIGVNK
ncbi:uncharacterized protein TNCV_3792571 [Trichonephila clavipes]|nr:uncharacterized protein TNCV_3792571 [Trichonephila clavipes]